MLATKLYPLLPTTPGTTNLTNFPKRKTSQSATLQSLYINKNERTLFPRFVVVGFLYSFGSSRQNFQIFFTHTVKQGIKLTAAGGLLLFPFREKELVCRVTSSYKICKLGCCPLFSIDAIYRGAIFSVSAN